MNRLNLIGSVPCSFVLAVCLVGCATKSMVTKQEDFEERDRAKWMAEDYFANAEYDSLEARFRRELKSCDLVDRPMFRLQLASVLLMEGKRDEAHQTLTDAQEELETLFDPDAEAKALSLWHGEQEKVYKGDGWERATLYAFLGLSFLDFGDWKNAVKCAENGILCDSDSQKNEYVADYALLPYIGYLAAVRKGDASKEDKFARLYKDACGREIPRSARCPNALLVCWAGRGATYELGGEFEEKRYVVPGSDLGALDSVSVASSGKDEVFSLGNIADLNFQATTRGGRLMDNVLGDKAAVKRGFAASANVLLVMSAALAASGGQNATTMIVCYPTAGLLAVLGGSSYLVGKAVTAKADGRIWGCLPGRLLVVPLDLADGESELVLNGYRNWDNTLRTKCSFVRAGEGISVRHVSLLPFRKAMEEVWQKDVYRTGDATAALSQLQRNETKCELTEEGDR